MKLIHGDWASLVRLVRENGNEVGRWVLEFTLVSLEYTWAGTAKSASGPTCPGDGLLMRAKSPGQSVLVKAFRACSWAEGGRQGLAYRVIFPMPRRYHRVCSL